MVKNSLIKALEMSLNGATLRQNCIAHNLSNVNTPGYKSLQVSFEEELKNLLTGDGHKIELKTTKGKHISNKTREFAVTAVKDNSAGLRADGNNVDIDKEMVEMAKNNIYYDTVVGQLNKRLEILKYIGQDGRR